MTVREALTRGASVLSGTGSETPRLDASLLLARAAGCGRAALLARLSDPLLPDAETAYSSFLSRRAEGESVAYILGEKEFYGRRFRVDPRVLVPRPDTETLVEAALAAARGVPAGRPAGSGIPTLGAGAPGSGARRSGPGTGLRIHDAFTGSGCVGITLAAELPYAEVSLSDLSPGARDLAARNAREILGRDLPVLESDVLAGVSGPFDVITANPPYVSSAETDRLLGRPGPGHLGPPGADGIRCEPREALDGGSDGLRFYRVLVPEAEKALAPGGCLAVEIGEEQGAAVGGMFRERGFRNVETLRDLGGRDRVVRGIRA